LPVGYGGRFPVTPVAPELQPHLLASLSSTHPINNRSKIENRLFPEEKKAEVQHSVGSWTLQLKLATEALARASETKDFDLLYSDMVFLRFNRVNLNWLLHYHHRLHTPPGAGEIDGATMDELRDLQTAWLAYMSQWQKNSELYGKEMHDSMVSPLHLDADLELMKVILHPLSNQRKSLPPKSEQWSTINKAFFVSQLHERFPSVKLRELLNEEWLSRRYCSGQEILTLRELQLLCEALRGTPAGLAFEPRHNRVVSGLRVGLLVHTEDEALSVADIYKTLQPTLSKGKPSQRMNNLASGQNNVALDRPYNVLVAELHARMMLGKFGPAYQDVINWDYDHIGKLEISCQKLPHGLRTAWSEYWDYAIIVHCPPENKLRYTARLVDLVNFEEFEKVVFETERPWNFTPHTWFEPLAKLMRSLDHNIVLGKWDMVTNETIARRIENLKQSSNRESPSRLLVEFSFYQHAHKLQSNPLEGFAKDRPALANHLKLLNEGNSEQRAELVLTLAQSLLGETFSMTWVGAIYPVP
jgi:hypothetical protein